MVVPWTLEKKEVRLEKRPRLEKEMIIGFSDQDKTGTFQPCDDALVMALWIRGFEVKWVMVDQGSAMTGHKRVDP